MTAETSDADDWHRTQSRSKKRAPGASGKSTAGRSINVSPRALEIREEVQQRIASDLHDSTCQHLIAASLNITRMRRAIEQCGDAAGLCDDLDASIDEAIREIRAFTYILYPPNLLADGLKCTVEQFVRGFARRASLHADLTLSPEVDDLPLDAQRAVLRVIQEALMNVFRHAKAKRVTVALRAFADRYELRISDDGCGMPMAGTKADSRPVLSGVGICAMGARLRELGATLQIHASSGSKSHGTTLSAVIPRAESRPAARRRGGPGAHKVMHV